MKRTLDSETTDTGQIVVLYQVETVVRKKYVKALFKAFLNRCLNLYPLTTLGLPSSPNGTKDWALERRDSAGHVLCGCPGRKPSFT